MKAAVLTGPNEMTVREVETPEPGAGDVLVRVKACGVCQTDYLGFTGARENMPYPTIMGHEISGIVDKTGPGVKGFKAGDEVIVNPMINCGYCDNCPEGIPVPKLMDVYNHMQLSGQDQAGRDRLKWHWDLPASAAEGCSECGDCERACTQHLPIIERLRAIGALGR